MFLLILFYTLITPATTITTPKQQQCYDPSSTILLGSSGNSQSARFINETLFPLPSGNITMEVVPNASSVPMEHFLGVVYDGQNHIWLIPVNDPIVRVHTQTLAMTSFAHQQGLRAFSCAAIDVKTDSLFLIPSSARNVHRLHLRTGAIAPFGVLPSAFINYNGSSLTKFMGAVVDHLGGLWMAPANAASAIVRFDTRNESAVKAIPRSEFPVNYVMTTTTHFWGAIYDGMAVWLVPSNANCPVRIDLMDHSLMCLSGYPYGWDIKSFYGGAFDGKRSIFLAPSNSAGVWRLDTLLVGVMAFYSDWGGNGWTAIAYTFRFSGLVFDGFDGLWLPPLNPDRLVRMNADSGSMTRYTNWPTGVDTAVKTLKYSGAVFDGKHLWMSPYESTSLVRISCGLSQSECSALARAPCATTAVVDTNADEDEASSCYDPTVPHYGSDGFSTALPFRDTIYPLPKTNLKFTALTTWGTDVKITQAGGAFRGIVYDGRGAVWMIPRNSNKLIRINTTTAAMRSFGAWPPGVSPTSPGFAGGIMGDNGFLWLVPQNAPLVRVDTSDGSMTSFSQWPEGVRATTSDKFLGGVKDKEGFLWLIPHKANAIVRVTQTTTTNVTLDAFGKLPFAQLDTTTDVFVGGIYDGSSIWCVPYHAKCVLRFDPTDPEGSMTCLSNWPPNTWVVAGFCGGAFDSKNRVWLAPLKANAIVSINIFTHVMQAYSNNPPGWGYVNGVRYVGAVFDGGDSIWFIPLGANMLVRMDIVTNELFGDVDLIPPATSKSNAEKFGGGAFDGRRLWLAPSAVTSVGVVECALTEEGCRKRAKRPCSAKQLAARKQATALCYNSSSTLITGSDGFGSSAPFRQEVIHEIGMQIKIEALDWPSANGAAKAAFIGCVYDGRGKVWFVPADYPSVLSISVQSGAMAAHTRWPEGYTVTQGQFWGGAIEAGETIEQTYVWLAPHNADRIVRVNVASGLMDGFNDWPANFALPSAKRAFVGVINDQHGSLWFVPSQARQFLRLKLSDHSMHVYSPPISPDLPTGLLPNSFSGGVADGLSVWMAPVSQRCLMRIYVPTSAAEDETNNITMRCYSRWPPGTNLVANAFCGIVFDGTSKLFLVPEQSNTIFRVDIWTGLFSKLATVPSGSQYFGGVFDGISGVWFIPNEATELLRLDVRTTNDGAPATLTIFTNGTLFSTKFAFTGGAFDGQYLWLAPYDAGKVVRISCGLIAGMCSHLNSSSPCDGKASAPSQLQRRRDSRCYDSTSRGAFCGGDGLGSGTFFSPTKHPRLYGVGSVMDVDYFPLSLNVVPSFSGATYDGQGSVWFAPLNAKSILRLNTTTAVMSAFTTSSIDGFSLSAEAFQGAATDDQGFVWFCPRKQKALLRVDPRDGSMKVFNQWPSVLQLDNSNTSHFFTACTFDPFGKALWLCPSTITAKSMPVRVDTRDGSMIAVPWPASFLKNVKT